MAWLSCILMLTDVSSGLSCLIINWQDDEPITDFTSGRVSGVALPSGRGAMRVMMKWRLMSP